MEAACCHGNCLQDYGGIRVAFLCSSADRMAHAESSHSGIACAAKINATGGSAIAGTNPTVMRFAIGSAIVLVETSIVAGLHFRAVPHPHLAEARLSGSKP